MLGWVAGDTPKVTLIFKDDGDNSLQDLSISGVTANLEYSMNGVAVVQRVMTAKSPQTGDNLGKADYTFTIAELLAGTIKISGFLTDSGGGVYSMIRPEDIDIRAKL